MYPGKLRIMAHTLKIKLIWEKKGHMDQIIMDNIRSSVKDFILYMQLNCLEKREPQGKEDYQHF